MKDLLTRNILLLPFLGLKPQVYESFVDSASEKIDSGNSELKLPHQLWLVSELCDTISI